MAAMPTFAYLGGVINPSAAEAAAAVCLWASLLLLVSQPSSPRRVVVRVGVAVAVLALARPLGPGFALGVIATVLLLAADRPALARLARRRSVRWTAAVAGLVLIGASVHVIATDALGSVITSETGFTPTEAARRAWEATGQHLRDQVGLVSWVGRNELHAPSGFVDGWLAVVTALVLAALVVGTWRHRLVVLALSAGVLVLPVAAQASSPEVNWQGRYTLPVLLGVPILAGWVVDRTGRVPALAGQILLVGGAAALAAGLFVTQQLLMSRNLYGFPAPIFTEPNDAYWDGPGSPEALRLGAALAALAMVALAVASLDRWWPTGSRSKPTASSDAARALN
jgi:hypothetical protein